MTPTKITSYAVPVRVDAARDINAQEAPGPDRPPNLPTSPAGHITRGAELTIVIQERTGDPAVVLLIWPD